MKIMRSFNLFLFLLFSLSYGLTQELENLDTIQLPKTHFVDQNITKLADKLLEGQQGDFDKFNRLFLWVVKSISYDVQKANSTNGSPLPDLNKILRTKSGICTDIAFLMDTLCKQAQLESYIVQGFAKDNLFDVGDPIYESNHVWNAVKLNGLWYLYDATWSQGRLTYEAKLKRKKIHDLQDKLYPKVKRKKYIIRIPKSECNKKKIKEKRFYNDHIFSYKLLSLFFHKRKYKVKHVFQMDKSYNFYLTHPQILALTHIPENPIWLLDGQTYHQIENQESDSSFYYLTKKIYALQNRSGTPCEACDALNSLAPDKKLELEIESSKTYNQKNQTSLWEKYYYLGDFYFQKAVNSTDTNQLLVYLDSSLFNYSISKNCLKKNIDHSKLNHSFLSKKNKKKFSQLISKNLIHLNTNRIHMNALKHRQKNIEGISKSSFLLNAKSYSLKRGFNYQAEKTIRIFKGKIPSSKLENLENKMEKMDKEIDSLNATIQALRINYDTLINYSTNQVWKLLTDTLSIDRFFAKSSLLRSQYLCDDYKKTMVDLYEELKQFEKQHNQFLYDSIYSKSDSCYLLMQNYKKFLQKRNKYLQKQTELMKVYTKFSGMTNETYSQKLIQFGELMQEDVCWIKKRKPQYQFFIVGVTILLNQKSGTIETIKSNTKTEEDRFQSVSKIYKKNKKRSITISKENLNFIRDKEKEAKSKRKEILKLI
jgi:hypothetical protein